MTIRRKKFCGVWNPGAVSATLRGCLLVTIAVMTFGLSASAQAADAQPLPEPDALIALLQAGDYRELDARVSAYLRAYEEDTNLERPAVIAMEAFERSRPELEAQFNAWIAAYPQSYAARLARALYFSNLAWSNRGGEYSCKTADERFEAMNKYFDLATVDLNASMKLSAKPVLSNAYMINIVMARGMSAREKPLLDEALRLDPYSVRVRRVYMHSLQPEWGGSYDAMAAFVQATRKFPETAKLREIVAGLEATILERRGRDTMRAGDTKGALDYYGRALALSENATIYAARASALAKNERFKDAIADHDRALELNPNLTESHTRRGDLYRTLHDTKKALIDIRIAAERGDSEAQNLLGSMYYNGTGVPKNDKESSKWLRLAAAQGNADAQSGYGYMLFHGYGTQPDRNEAVEMWRRSARQGNEDARENLGLFEGFKIKVEMLLARFTGGGC